MPTAVQALADRQDTPVRSMPLLPVIVAVAWKLQLVPSQISEKSLPTATHEFADAQDTPLSWPAPGGCGGVWTIQLVPFPPAAGMAPLPAPPPTAVHAFAGGQATRSSTPPLVPAGLGVGCLSHGPPRLAAARVRVVAPRVSKLPAAVHALDETQDTAT